MWLKEVKNVKRRHVCAPPPVVCLPHSLALKDVWKTLAEVRRQQILVALNRLVIQRLASLPLGKGVPCEHDE